MAEAIDIRALNERIERESAFVTNLMTGMDQVIVGQKHLVESLLIGLLSDGHILLEGVPGLAKTLAIKTLASLIDAKYSRIQFTPDLLPADVIGTMIYSQKDETFIPNKGPIFANGYAGASGDVEQGNICFASAVLGNGYSEPDRTGRYVSTSRSTGRPFHVEGCH